MVIKIEHIAIWTNALETMKSFYEDHFAGKVQNKYENPLKGFQSYFITFEGGARLELMSKLGLKSDDNEERIGIAHIAFSVGKPEDVDSLTTRLRRCGVKVIGEPRWTGDGYYESVIQDPDGNAIEIVAESQTK